MKKIFAVLVLFFAINTSIAYAVETVNVSDSYIIKAQDQISNIGFKILNSNGIEKRTVFVFDTSKKINAFSSYRDRQIVLYRGMYNQLQSEDEIAAVLSHEIAHSVESYNGIFRGYFSSLSYMCSPKKYEYKADKRAVDYMVNAGYHPIALIVMMSKVMPQERYDWYNTHPLTSRRMMEVYEYIYKKYPEYLVNNTYKNNIYYQNFLLTSKQNRAKFQKKIETKSKLPVNYL